MTASEIKQKNKSTEKENFDQKIIMVNANLSEAQLEYL